MKGSLGAAMLVAIVLAASACGSSHPAVNNGPPLTPRAGSSSRFILGGAVRCTATLPSSVQVGDELGVSVKFENVSDHTVNVLPAYGGIWVLVRSADGTTYDTRVPLENSLGTPPGPIPLEPGATVTRHLLSDLRVRWEGPLRVTPGCDASAARPVRVDVTPSELPASATQAIDDVVAATGHLLDHCRPQTDGVSVVGRIEPPNGLAPPMPARCSISLSEKRGFYIAQVLVVTPPDLQGVHVDPTYDALSGTNVRNRNTEAIAWQFVVTRQGATSVNSAGTVTARSGGGWAPEWFWSSETSSESRNSGAHRCGFFSSSFGNGNGPSVWFVSACGR